METETEKISEVGYSSVQSVHFVFLLFSSNCISLFARKDR